MLWDFPYLWNDNAKDPTFSKNKITTIYYKVIVITHILKYFILDYEIARFFSENINHKKVNKIKNDIA